MKNKITLLVTALLTLALVLAVSAVSFAAEEETDKPFVIGQKTVLQPLDLNAATLGVGLDGTGTAKSYEVIYEYDSQTETIMDLEIVKGKSDKHPTLGTYDIKIDNSIVTQDAAKAYTLSKGKHTIEVIRTYTDVQTDPWISISVKALPTDITSEFSGELTKEESGTDYLTRFYKFTPSQSGGYEFTIDGLNESTLKNQFVQLAIENNTGKMLNESVTLDEGQKSCKLRVYLTGNTEYIVSVRDERVNIAGPLENMKYTFTAKKVMSGTGVSVSGAIPLSLAATNECKIYPFLNKRAFAYYSFTATEEGYYEFTVTESAVQSDNNDLTVELRDADFSPVEEEDQLQLYSGEGGTLIRRLGAGETCYIQVCEMYKGALADVYTRNIAVSKHVHSTKAVVDGDHVTISCPCMDESQFVCDFWLEGVSFKDAAYTGSAVDPTPKFDIFGWYSKDGSAPNIPASAYEVTVTSKNKKDIGKATAKLTFKGDYEDLGSFTASFKIVPAGTALKTVTGGAKALTVKWAKQSRKTTGYQIQYSTSSKFSGAKTVTVNKNTAVSKKITKLKSKKTYYVRVRTYKTIGKTKYYSAWSSTMSGKTK